MKITEEQSDTLKELFNVGVCAAAKSIEELSGTEVELTVPHLSLISIGDLINELIQTEGSTLTAISQVYSGPFDGTALMFYSQQSSFKLVQIMMKTDTAPERMSDLETDALCEVGNIVLNACLSSIGNIFETEIETRIPTICTGSVEEIITLQGRTSKEKMVIFLKMGFTLSTHEICSYISFMLDTDKIDALLKYVDRYIEKVLG